MAMAAGKKESIDDKNKENNIDFFSLNMASPFVYTGKVEGISVTTHLGRKLQNEYYLLSYVCLDTASSQIASFATHV